MQNWIMSLNECFLKWSRVHHYKNYTNAIYTYSINPVYTIHCKNKIQQHQQIINHWHADLKKHHHLHTIRASSQKHSIQKRNKPPKRICIVSAVIALGYNYTTRAHIIAAEIVFARARRYLDSTGPRACSRVHLRARREKKGGTFLFGEQQQRAATINHWTRRRRAAPLLL